MSLEIEEFKRLLKQKDLALFTLEEECQHEIRTLNQTLNFEKKKIISEYENRVREQLADRN